VASEASRVGLLVSFATPLRPPAAADPPLSGEGLEGDYLAPVLSLFLRSTYCPACKMENMRRTDTFAALLALIGLSGAVAVLALDKIVHITPLVWYWVFWNSVTVVLLCALNSILLFLHGRIDGGRKFRMTPVLLINLGLSLFVVGIVWLFSPTAERERAESLGEFITWDLLSAEQIALFKKELSVVPVGTASIGCKTVYCARFAAQLVELFRDAKWSAVIRSHTLPSDTANTGTGLSISPNIEAGRAMQKAIQSSTGIHVDLSAQQENEPTDKPFHLMISILGKPLPEPLPDTIQQDLAVLGRRLGELAAQVLQFATDREQLQARSFSAADHQDFQAQVNFMRETERLMTERFGARLTAHLSELSALGIIQPFWVQSNAPTAMGRFLGAMGSFLEQGRLFEARANARDNQHWFKQVSP
jgi:hypothetical protein